MADIHILVADDTLVSVLTPIWAPLTAAPRALPARI